MAFSLGILQDPAFNQEFKNIDQDHLQNEIEHNQPDIQGHIVDLAG